MVLADGAFRQVEQDQVIGPGPGEHEVAPPGGPLDEDFLDRSDPFEAPGAGRQAARLMTLTRMYAGDGYRYLLSTVADVEPTAASARTRYYMEAGTPPGRWAGHGLVGFDRGSGLPAGAVVDEAQMERLFRYVGAHFRVHEEQIRRML